MALEEQELLSKLATAESLKDAQSSVLELERRFKYSWRPVGDNEANYGLINIGSDPGHALIERITNALDAVIEREAVRRLHQRGDGVPVSPREAIEMWFGIPGGRVSNIGATAKRQPLADQTRVGLLEGTRKRQPSVVIRDLGIGLTPSLVPSTILSLSGTNKIDKPYLAGAYGQGGSTVLAFSPAGALFVSRRQPDLLGDQPDLIAVTFAKYEELDPAKNKNGRYAYLVTAKREVPWISAKALVDFEPGTRVVHFDLEIPKYAAAVTQLTGSLWWLTQNALFDPLLPFWVEDNRASILAGKKVKERRTIIGNHTRLMDDRKNRVEHSGSIDVHIDHQDGATVVKAHYWVVRAKEGDGSRKPIDAYVDPYRPIAYTYYGQTHGTDERRFTTERLQLPYLADFLVIQVELDNLTPSARRELLSSTRDRLKRTPFFDDMREGIVSALSEDEQLVYLNDLRKEQLLSRHSKKDQERMRQRFAKMMERLPAGTDATVAAKGNEGAGRPPHPPSESRKPLEPLPTKAEPTFVRIANVKKPLPVRIDRHALVRLESDAPDDYLKSHVHAKLTMMSQPQGLIALESKSDFRGGRARFTVKTTEAAKLDSEGKLGVFLFTPDDQSFSDDIAFRVEPKKEHPTSGDQRKADVKAPTPIPVTKKEWSEFGWDETSVADPREDNEGGKIYVNADNVHLTNLLRKGGYQKPGIKRMRNNFILYVAFYTWSRHAELKRREIGLEGKEFEDYQAAELDRVAQTVIHSIASGTRLADED